MNSKVKGEEGVFRLSTAWTTQQNVRKTALNTVFKSFQKGG